MPILNYNDVSSWLKRFGYAEPIFNEENVSVRPTLQQAISRMQDAYGIEPTGEADDKTLKLMTIPRCGNPDLFPHREQLGVNSPTMYKWNLPPNRTLLYYLDKESLTGLDLPYAEVQAIIRDAYSMWESTSDIKYQQIDSRGDANLVMSCGSGRVDGFDGPSNILAWAELPVQGAGQLNLKYDADEPWYGKTRQRGIALLNTTSHEVGHLNGLTHSKVLGALMAPTYSEAVPAPVKNDDVQRMVWRYGEPKPVIVPPVIPTPGTGPLPVEAIRVKYSGIEGWHEYKTLKV